MNEEWRVIHSNECERQIKLAYGYSFPSNLANSVHFIPYTAKLVIGEKSNYMLTSLSQTPAPDHVSSRLFVSYNSLMLKPPLYNLFGLLDQIL